MKNRGAATAVWLLLLASLAVVAMQLRVGTDMSAFLPRGAGVDEQLLLQQLRSGQSNRILLLAIETNDTTQAAALSSELAAMLREDPHFIRVLNGEFQLSDATQEPWFRYRYLLQDSDFSAAALRTALQARLQELRSLPSLYARRNLIDDPTAAFRTLLQQWQANTNAPQQQHGVWFAPDGRAILFAETRAPGFDLDNQQQNLATIRNAFSALPASGAAQLIITGAPAIAVASRETIRNEARLATIAAAIAVALILLLAYRSWRLWLLSSLPLAGAMITALATTTLLFGTVHGITIAFGITLLGVAIDYPIHLFSHLSSGETPTRSLERIWPTLRLGVVSTAIGFLALLFTHFDGLIQLGAFTISGLLTAALVTRYLLPSLLPSSWQGRDYSHHQRQYPVVAHRSLPLMVALLLLALAVLALSDRPLWESDLAALSPIPDEVREQDQQLRAALPVADAGSLLLLQAEDIESLLQTQERLKPTLQSWVEDGVLGGFTLVADRLPSAARQRQRQQSLPTAEQITTQLDMAVKELPFRSSAFAPFVAALTESRELPPLTLVQLQKQAAGFEQANLLFENEGAWWGIIPITGANNLAELTQRINALGNGIHYVDLKAVTGQMLTRFKDDALRNLAWGALAILLVLGWSSRDPRRVMRIGLLLATSIAVTLALLHLLGERLTLFHLTSLLLVAGIGIDYGLFFSRAEVLTEQGKTAHALRICAISTTTVFAILAFSRLPVLHAIGLTVLLGVITAYWLARICVTESEGEPDRNTEVPHAD